VIEDKFWEIANMLDCKVTTAGGVAVFSILDTNTDLE